MAISTRMTHTRHRFPEIQLTCQPFKAKNRPRPTLRLRIDFLHISGFGRGLDDLLPKLFCCLVAARNCDFPRAWPRIEHRPSRRFTDALTSELPQNEEFR